MSDESVKEDVEQIGEILAIRPRYHCSYIKINFRGLSRMDIWIIIMSVVVTIMIIFTGAMVILLIYTRLSS